MKIMPNWTFFKHSDNCCSCVSYFVELIFALKLFHQRLMLRNRFKLICYIVNIQLESRIFCLLLFSYFSALSWSTEMLNSLRNTTQGIIQHMVNNINFTLSSLHSKFLNVFNASTTSLQTAINLVAVFLLFFRKHTVYMLSYMWAH